jgi:hypothetical protein
MTIKNVIRCVVIVGAFASMLVSLGACHSRASDAVYRSTHGRG